MQGRIRHAFIAAAFVVMSPVTGWSVDYAPYHQFSEIEQKLRAIASDEKVEVMTIGRSAGGRPIAIVRVAGPGPDPDRRPAVFVGANIAGRHNAGSEAALDLIDALLAGGGHPLLKKTTFYIAPALNPDAHDALFAAVRSERRGNAMRIDRDADGFEGEDGFDDLDGDGRITFMRIADPRGDRLPHPADARVMVEADALRSRAGAFRVEREGDDDDGDGKFNEDPSEGIVLDMNFPKAFPWPKREAGPWSTSAPEVEALIRFLFDRPNLALAFVYGPANNFLAAPRAIEPGGDPGSQKFKVPPQFAEALGFDPDEEYSLDQVWEAAKGLPFVVQNKVTREQLAQYLGAGAATRPDDADLKLYEHLARDYRERLKNNGLDAERPAEQYGKGGLTPWLYYQYGVPAIELDVWRIPKRKDGEKSEEKLTVDRLEAMSGEEFLKLGEEKVAAFLKEIEAPPQFTAATVMERVRSGQVTPKAMAGMIRQMGGAAAAGGDDDDDATKRTLDIVAWIDEHAPEAFAPWKLVALSDGTPVEVGGVDPFIEFAPPIEHLRPALTVHTATLLDIAGRLPRVEIVELEAKEAGAGVYRVRAVAANRGFLPTHTQMAVRARALLPVRLSVVTGDGIELVAGRRTVTSERLEGVTGTVEGEWLVRAPKGASITVEVVTQNSGSDRRSVVAGKGGAR